MNNMHDSIASLFEFENDKIPSRDISVSVSQDDITKAVSSMFDYEFNGTTTFTVPNVPSIPEDYGIGLIVGPSGSGKSSLLKSFGSTEQPEWDESKAICSHFESADQAAERLSAVGLNTIPSWLRPYHVLSNGEQFRANLARSLVSGMVFDEFTSVIDRNVAKSCSVAIRRYVDKHNLKNIVLATCHYDVIEWLQPDWVYDTMTGQLTGRGSLRPRPEIKLEIIPCSTEVWPIFRHHHYLDGNLNRTAQCWLAIWDGEIVGFSAALPFPNGNFKNAWRGHRTVILPEYQGLGFGTRLSDAIGEIFLARGCRFFSKTAHPRLGEYRNSSPRWRGTSKNGKGRKDYITNRAVKEKNHKDKHIKRVCFSHEYVGKTLDKSNT